MVTTLLTEKEFKSTFTGQMVDVTETAEPTVDIWPYVEQLTIENMVDKYVFEKTLVEKVYRNQTNSFEQILLPTQHSNNFVIIVVDLVNKSIYGHYLLNLNALYGGM